MSEVESRFSPEGELVWQESTEYYRFSDGSPAEAEKAFALARNGAVRCRPVGGARHGQESHRTPHSYRGIPKAAPRPGMS
jgi:hypothetical protein